MTLGRLSLAWATHEGRECLRIRGLPAQRADDVFVFTAEALHAGAGSHPPQPVAGERVVTDGEVLFVPRFPFVPGLAYAVRAADGTSPPANGPTIVRGDGAIPTATVTGIYPDTAEVPLNLLRIYVHFSAPMAEGAVGRAVRVSRRDTGTQLHDVFYRGRSELWDPARRRLTLLLDPGRIKRGLAPHEASGYPLIERIPIAVTVGTEFRDACGAPLSAAASRAYDVGPAIRERVDPAGWRLDLPAAGSLQPLRIDFGRPLDHALAGSRLHVLRDDLQPVAGDATVLSGDSAWEFRPAAPWAAGRYGLAVDPLLEDLAGNSVTRVFDRDLSLRADDPVPPSPPRAFIIEGGPPR